MAMHELAFSCAGWAESMPEASAEGPHVARDLAGGRMVRAKERRRAGRARHWRTIVRRVVR